MTQLHDTIDTNLFCTYLSILAVPRFDSLYGGEGVLPEGNGQPPLCHQLTDELHNASLAEWTSKQREDLSSRVDGHKSLEYKSAKDRKSISTLAHLKDDLLGSQIHPHPSFAQSQSSGLPQPTPTCRDITVTARKKFTMKFYMIIIVDLALLTRRIFVCTSQPQS